MPKKTKVVAQGADNRPNQAVENVGRVTCAMSSQNPNLVQEQNKDDQEQDVRRDTSEVDDPQESKDAESEESKHADVEEADETGTEEDAASSTNPESKPEAEGDEEQELASEASQVPKKCFSLTESKCPRR